jgi:predicted metal-binding protein
MKSAAFDLAQGGELAADKRHGISQSQQRPCELADCQFDTVL